MEFYKAVCAKYKVKINSHVVEVLQRTTATENVTLTITGNHRLRPVQRLDDDDIRMLVQCLQIKQGLTGLDLKFNNITDEGVIYLAELLQKENSSLSCLDLMFNDILTDGAKILCSSLQGNRTLLSLRLSGNKIGNKGGMHLAKMLQENDTLQELELADCDLGIQSIIALIISMKSHKALRRVDLSRPLLFSHLEEWAVHCTDMLMVNCIIVELHLAKMGMTDTGMQRLAEGLRLNRSLRYLDLRCNRVTRDGIRYLAEVLKQNPTLEIIDLSSNRIEGEGAKYLSEAITCPGCSVKELSVTRNNIKAEGLLALTQAMTANKTLTHIYVWGNHKDEPVCKAFRDLLSSGRLLPQHTDVSAYEVDGHIYLAEVFNALRRHYRTDSSGTDDTYNSLLGDRLKPTAST
ncbi:leucine-rich repeat-containing protein 34-like [Solea solea]|uniref:leucine-rich repeat-containing protein 34-like n=1 Tax=Solea solea TaxID=90069 RepID=UPI002729E5D5|nr:leucine-rich repeat-containing protein 34-like [Solea solea]